MRTSRAITAMAFVVAATALAPGSQAAPLADDAVRWPLPPIAPALTAAERARFVPLPEPTGRVPVLLFHQICEVTCRPQEEYAMTREELAKTLAMLELAGYETISVDAYVRFLRGITTGLPRRPILLTFDDSRSDAWIGAHSILAAAHARATMYVITARSENGDPDYMRWREVEAAAASGVWDLQLHAHAGHSSVPVAVSADGAPVMKHAFAWRRWSREPTGDDAPSTGSLETFAEWRERVVGDLDHGDALLAAHVPGYRSLTFAVPYSDYGQVLSNDGRIPASLRDIFDERFEAWFSQPGPDPEFSFPGRHQEKSRFVVYRATTAEQIYMWLERHGTR
ncbi:MAG: polysaccharide deacetylase family protein [Deltaproteobacteria bacterium]|nr:polysaccharide deacetylase family protein [Deltaproteobacteria bacterium]